MGTSNVIDLIPEKYWPFPRDSSMLSSGSMPDLHMMVDLETMDVEETAAILTIGAVMFDPRGLNEEDNFDDTFEIRMSLQSNMAVGRTVDASTICWWMTQSDAARDDLVSGEQVNLGVGLFTFGKWISNRVGKPTRAWAKSPDFDCSMLSHAFKQANEIWPFHFADNRCVRTITELAYPEGDAPLIGVGVAHNALDDAKRQALMVQHCYHTLNA